MIPSPALSPSLHSLFDIQHGASRVQAGVPLALRCERLLKIRALLAQHGPAFRPADSSVQTADLTGVVEKFAITQHPEQAFVRQRLGFIAQLTAHRWIAGQAHNNQPRKI